MPCSFVETVGKPQVNAPGPGDSRSDEALVEAAKEGHERAFESLLKRYQARMFRLALRHTRVREDAEDVVQQTFLKAFIHFHRFEGKSAFCTWLTRIAINEALQLLRRNRRLRDVPIDSTNYNETEHSFDLADSGPGPESSYLLREDRELLTAAVERLGPVTRSVVEFQLRELSVRETAQHMGLSVCAVKARVFHGRKQLREALRHHRTPRRAILRNASKVRCIGSLRRA
jgi:RNA polymerase sigma-70 factor, ECF subfamily